MTTFNAYMKENEETLELYTTAITRAHGKSHPEAFDVRELYTEINDKTKEAGADKPELDAVFAELRSVTSGYAIPDDVCETYAAVYTLLSEADQVYQA